MPLGIDATTRYAANNWTRPLTKSELATRLAVQHAHAPRAAADADRQPRARVAEGGGAAGEGSATSTTSSSRAANGAHAFSRTEAQFETRRRGLRAQARRARRQGPVAVLSVRTGDAAASRRDHAARRARLAGRAQPLAGDAQRRARASSGSTTGATSCCPSRPSASRRPCARSHGAGFVGANVTIPHKEAALALATTRERARAGDRRREHADVRRGRRDRGRQHRRAGPDRGAARAAASRLAARSCSAPAAARAPSAGRCARPASRSASGTGRLSAPSGSPPISAIHAVRRAVPADLLVNCTSVGLSLPSSTFKQLPVAVEELDTYATVVDLVYTAQRHGAPRDRGARRQQGRRRAGDPGPPRGAEPRGLDRPRGTDRDDARRRASWRRTART